MPLYLAMAILASNTETYAALRSMAVGNPNDLESELLQKIEFLWETDTKWYKWSFFWTKKENKREKGGEGERETGREREGEGEGEERENNDISWG